MLERIHWLIYNNLHSNDDGREACLLTEDLILILQVSNSMFTGRMIRGVCVAGRVRSRPTVRCCSGGSAAEQITEPSSRQLRVHFAHCMTPMVRPLKLKKKETAVGRWGRE